MFREVAVARYDVRRFRAEAYSLAPERTLVAAAVGSSALEASDHPNQPSRLIQEKEAAAREKLAE